MLSIAKRYGIALVFLLLVVVLMIFATMGVKSFEEKMFEDINVSMKPRGEIIEL